MATVNLVPDADTSREFTAGTNVHLSGTTGVSATFTVPAGMTMVWVGVPTMASGTIDFKATLAGSMRTVGNDIYGTTYPRTAFTGNSVLLFAVPQGAACQVSLAATGTALDLQVMAGR